MVKSTISVSETVKQSKINGEAFTGLRWDELLNGHFWDFMALTLLNKARHGMDWKDFELFCWIKKCFEDVSLTVLGGKPLASASGLLGLDISASA